MILPPAFIAAAADRRAATDTPAPAAAGSHKNLTCSTTPRWVTHIRPAGEFCIIVRGRTSQTGEIALDRYSHPHYDAMQPEEWVRLCDSVRAQMGARVRRIVTPISRSVDLEHGFAWGTGSYISLPSGAVALLTNEHVARLVTDEHLSHLPDPGKNYELISEFRAWSAPEDLAVGVVPANRLAPERSVLSVDDLDRSYNPEPYELLYCYGFPGSTARRNDSMTENNMRYSWFGELEVAGLSMVSQQIPEWPSNLPADFIPDYHVLVHYPAQSLQSPAGPPVDVPNPKGMSGSLLWDTKAVKCLRRGVAWHPSVARVCGIIWATWHKPEIVIATKVEYLHKFIADVDRPPSV